MKKILLVAMAATMFAACTQNEELENAGSNKEMKFNTAVMSTTRATTTTNGTFKEFKLYAYFGEKNANTIINGKVFTKDTESSKWACGAEVFYWPGAENVSFYGYSPSTLTCTGAETPTLAYTVDADASKQVDLLVTSPKSQNSEGGAVALSFSHALTKMAFQVSGTNSDVTYKITSITINAKSAGNYTFGAGWDAGTTPIDYSVATNVTDIIGDAAATTVGETLMMLPQQGAKITVAYTYSTTGTGEITATPKSFTIDWEAGKNLLYTIALDGPSVMDITGEVIDGDWANTPDSGTLTPAK